MKHGIDKRGTALKTTTGPLRVRKFHELWSKNDINRTAVFIHPPYRLHFASLQASHTEFNEQNSTKHCQTVGCTPRYQTAVKILGVLSPEKDSLVSLVFSTTSDV